MNQLLIGNWIEDRAAKHSGLAGMGFILAAHSQFKAEAPVKNCGGIFDNLGTSLLPGTYDTDGFYVALLRRSP